MNLMELERALRQLRLGGMAAVLETRVRQAQAEAMAPIDLISCLVTDELTRRSDRLLERRRKQAAFRDPVGSNYSSGSAVVTKQAAEAFSTADRPASCKWSGCGEEQRVRFALVVAFRMKMGDELGHGSVE